MNLNRVNAIIIKDFYWARNNSKLLGITLMPALMNIFFAKVAGASAFTTGLGFSISFLGVFLTSFLLIEEKRKGTLKALLTTPLTNSELLSGKFIFTFSLCILVSIFAIFINKRYDILTNPIALFNIAIFSATTCCIGFIQGLFFKNEQEMGIAAPFILLSFVIGPTINSATKSEIAAFFPDYHFTHAIDSGELSYFELLFHSGYGILIASAAFIFAVSYAKFYFSSNDEKRFSPKLFLIFLGFISVFIISGLISPKLLNNNNKILKNKLSKIEFTTESWSGFFSYDPAKTELKRKINNKDLKKYSLSNESIKLDIQIRATRTQEQTEKGREKTIRTKKSAQIIAKEDLIINNIKFKKWVYMQDENKLSILAEAFCKQHLFQVFFDLEKNDFQHISKNIKLLNQTLENSQLNCSRPNASKSDSTGKVGN